MLRRWWLNLRLLNCYWIEFEDLIFILNEFFYWHLDVASWRGLILKPRSYVIRVVQVLCVQEWLFDLWFGSFCDIILAQWCKVGLGFLHFLMVRFSLLIELRWSHILLAFFHWFEKLLFGFKWLVVLLFLRFLYFDVIFKICTLTALSLDIEEAWVLAHVQ